MAFCFMVKEVSSNFRIAFVAALYETEVSQKLTE